MKTADLEIAVASYFDYVDNVIVPNVKHGFNKTSYEADHIHILFSAHPNSSLCKFINAYKSSSSRLIKKEFPEIRKSLWREMFWSCSFCILTVGGAPLEILKQYIATQGEK